MTISALPSAPPTRGRAATDRALAISGGRGMKRAGHRTRERKRIGPVERPTDVTHCTFPTISHHESHKRMSLRLLYDL